MVFHTANENRFAIDLLQNHRHISMQLRANFQILEERNAVFRAKGHMNNNPGK